MRVKGGRFMPFAPQLAGREAQKQGRSPGPLLLVYPAGRRAYMRSMIVLIPMPAPMHWVARP